MVVCVPPVRIVDRVGIDIPAVVVSVPVRVHGPESFRAKRHLCHRLAIILETVSNSESLLVSASHQLFYFLKPDYPVFICHPKP